MSGNIILDCFSSPSRASERDGGTSDRPVKKYMSYTFMSRRCAPSLNVCA